MHQGLKKVLQDIQILVTSALKDSPTYLKIINDIRRQSEHMRKLSKSQASKFASEFVQRTIVYKAGSRFYFKDACDLYLSYCQAFKKPTLSKQTFTLHIKKDYAWTRDRKGYYFPDLTIRTPNH